MTMKISFTKKSIPFALLIFLSLTFGLLLFWQGFYTTDWTIILASRLDDPGEILHGLQDRWSLYPWLHYQLVNLIGAVPILWQIISLLLRYFTVLAMWWSLTKLWPGNLREVTWMAFLFAIYPIFEQQSLAVTNAPLWIAYAAYFLSLAAMIQSFNRTRYAWLYTALGLIGTFFHMMIYRDFIGLELLRPVIIWFVSGGIPELRRRTQVTFVRWIPYVFVIVISLIFQYISDPKDGQVSSAATVSITGWVGWLQSTLQVLINLVFGAWNRTLEPSQIQFNDLFFVFSIAIAMIIAGLVGFYWLHLKINQGSQNGASLNNQFLQQAAALGALVLLLGMIMFRTYQSQASGIPQGGYALTAMFGLSVLLVTFAEWAISDQTRRIVLLCVLIGLAVSFHLRTANDFRWRWIKQTDLYWQFYWRAPDLEPSTVILSDSEFFIQNGGETSVSAALNLLYPSASSAQNNLYKFRLLNDDLNSIQTTDDQTPASSLAITYEPDQGNCLWMLSPLDTERPQVSRLVRQSLHLVDLGRIGSAPEDSWLPPLNIFGAEPDHYWCYYYQKAELARQSGDFKTIVKLADLVQQAGYEPNNVQEWLPFIEGYARENRWDEAQRISEMVHQQQPSFSQWLCSSWKRYLEESNPLDEQMVSIQNMLASFQCEHAQN